MLRKTNLRCLLSAAVAVFALSAAHAQTASNGNADGTSLVQLLSTAPAPEALAPFYDDSHKDLHPALSWMAETNRTSPTYWTLYTEAQIRLKLKDYNGAYATAQQARQLALAANPPSPSYAELSANVEAKAQARK